MQVIEDEENLLKNGPYSLEKLCTRKILDKILMPSGVRVEDRAKAIYSGHYVDQNKRKRRSSTTILTVVDDFDESETVESFAQTDFFQLESTKCREYLSSHLSSCSLDNLASEVQNLSHKSGFFFTLSSLCSARLTNLPINLQLRQAKF